ncbi:MAG: tRNA-dihydrouridine synthase family protein [Schaedlerella sp.]|nr:tRNA-dihydrouridine synthase family protein [Schaedlerella sp.]
MKIYFAPLEGITGYILRGAVNEYFGHIDKYFIPFINPNQLGRLSAREKGDIAPENNKGMHAVPQILTNSIEDFVKTAKTLQNFGYEEVNLNLGCPSKTVISKQRGSGFLAFPEELDRFLNEIFEQTEIAISVKTRIGKEDPEEFDRLLEIYNQYPMKELIIHPRVQTDFYKNHPNLDMYRKAVNESKNRLCYNGDIFMMESYLNFINDFPETDTIMIGRGLLRNPGLAREICTGQRTDKETLKGFHDRIYEDYQGYLFGEKNVLFKMKEMWCYMAPMFTNFEKYAKKIKKAERLYKYEEAVEALFKEQEIAENQTVKQMAKHGIFAQ